MFRKLTFWLIVASISIAPKCTNQTGSAINDPVQKSLSYQPWESTEQPAGSPEYLGLGPYAKCLCTAVFVSNRDPEEFVHHNDGIILEKIWVDSVKYLIDYAHQQVTASLGDTVSRTATFLGDQGCILDVDKGLHFAPVPVPTSLPPGETMQWPMGDRIAPLTVGYDPVKLDEVAQAAFDPQAITAAFLVIHHGQIILERYADGIDQNTQLESWSMGKSITATLIGRLMLGGKLTLDQRAPIPEWQREGDPRGAITIRHLMQMSSGCVSHLLAAPATVRLPGPLVTMANFRWRN